MRGLAGKHREEQEAGEPGNSNDSVQPTHVQQGELPVDQVCGQVLVRQLLPPQPQHAGLPRRGQ